MLVVHLDELGQLLLLDLDVDERIAVVVEDAEVAGRRGRRRSTAGGATRRTGRSRPCPRRGSGRSSRRRAPFRRFLRVSPSAARAKVTPWPRRVRSSSAPRFPARAPARSSSGRSASSPSRSGSTSRSSPPRAHGALVTDVDGNTFVDFTGGIGCLNVGHSHPRVVAAVQEQAARFFHTDFTIVPYEIYVDVRRAAARARAVLRPGEGRVLQLRRRGGRERGQVRARRTRSGRR